MSLIVYESLLEYEFMNLEFMSLEFISLNESKSSGLEFMNLL